MRTSRQPLLHFTYTYINKKHLLLYRAGASGQPFFYLVYTDFQNFGNHLDRKTHLEKGTGILSFFCSSSLFYSFIVYFFHFLTHIINPFLWIRSSSCSSISALSTINRPIIDFHRILSKSHLIFPFGNSSKKLSL